MTTPLDSAIFGPLFSDAEISVLLTDEAFVRALVDVEKALARAEARVGVIAANCAEAIGKTSADKIDLTALTKGTASSGFPIIALVQELRKQVSAEAAPFIHWGATTQDIMDTACVLQLRSAVNLIRIRLGEIARHLSALADRHRTTILAGRTHGQQALPISFGIKVASWLAPLLRHAERLDEISLRLFVVQFGGAAGTLAALGDKGLAVTRELACELDLAVPIMPWHAQRDSLVEFAGWLSLLTGTLGKMAQDVILLAQTEVGEAGESAEEGRGGSSTMPQKSNPIIRRACPFMPRKSTLDRSGRTRLASPPPDCSVCPNAKAGSSRTNTAGRFGTSGLPGLSQLRRCLAEGLSGHPRSQKA